MWSIVTIFVVNVHHTQLDSNGNIIHGTTVLPLKFTFKLTITRSSPLPPPPPPVAILHLVYNNKVQYFPPQKSEHISVLVV